MKNMLEQAKKGKFAVPHFNINNLEWTKFILEECERLKSPVILGASLGAVNYMGGFLTVSSLVQGLVKDLEITVPVVLHLDHGDTVNHCKEAIDAGFTSVMFDGSKYPIEENISMTKEVVEYAKLKNVSVEAEVGLVGGSDGVANASFYAKEEDCLSLVNETHVDALAPALGSVHGIYKGEPNLDFNRMKIISDKTNLPLVLHGGSGIPDADIKKSILSGICKINVNTELQIAFTNGVREFIKQNEKDYDPRIIIKAGEAPLKKIVEEKILLFGSNNRA